MIFLKSIFYYLTGAFTPGLAFKNFKREKAGGQILVVLYIIGVVAAAGLSQKPAVEAMGFGVGFAIYHLVLAYLLYLFIFRFAVGKIELPDALASVGFSLLPFAVAGCWMTFELPYAEVSTTVAVTWSGLIAVAGLHYLTSLQLWKSALVYLGSLLFVTILRTGLSGITS